MQTKQIIQSSANVIRITNIAKGNVYKRFEDSDYVYYGIVTDVLNDGINTIITATEYRKSWSSMEVSQKIMKGEKEYVLFPADIKEIESEFQSVISSKERDIVGYRKSIAEAEATIELTNKLISGELSKEPSSPSYKELTQEEFNEKVLALN
jgi:hypothetical protein